MKKLFTFLILTLSLVNGKDTFSKIDPKTFTNINCVPYAYGDFNADKRVDIFCVSNAGNQFEIWLAQEVEPLFQLKKAYKLKDNSKIFNIVPGDFDGDSIMDLLVVSQQGETAAFKMSYFKGQKSARYINDLEEEIVVSEGGLPVTILAQPFAADFNGDGKMDLLVQLTDLNITVPCYITSNDQGDLILDRNNHFDTKSLKLFEGFAQTVADMNGDFKQDLILVTHNNNQVDNLRPHFQVWTIYGDAKYYLINRYDPPVEAVVFGQSLFADFDSSGEIWHLLPACKDLNCLNSVIYLRKIDTEWNEIKIDFGTYGFIPDSSEFWGDNKILLKAGDYDLNGYIDLLVILKENNSTSGLQYVLLMSNIESPTTWRTNAPNFSRTFTLDRHITSFHSNVVQASFFDLYDDGYLDILLVNKNTKEPDENKVYSLASLKNEYYDDVYFLKVMVIPGRCGNMNKCPFYSLPYGLNSPGVMLKIETISFDYQRVILYAIQLSQSSYMSLQLPYTIFGLGSTANFVEHLTVGITTMSSQNQVQSYIKEWPLIIPNSQLIISPNPRNVPYMWKMQLFITPSKNILLTGISLGFLMIVLIVIISLLQLRERKMDEKERKLESQRFHFDGL